MLSILHKHHIAKNALRYLTTRNIRPVGQSQKIMSKTFEEIKVGDILMRSSNKLYQVCIKRSQDVMYEVNDTSWMSIRKDILFIEQIFDISLLKNSNTLNTGFIKSKENEIDSMEVIDSQIVNEIEPLAVLDRGERKYHFYSRSQYELTIGDIILNIYNNKYYQFTGVTESVSGIDYGGHEWRQKVWNYTLLDDNLNICFYTSEEYHQVGRNPKRYIVVDER